MSRIIPVFLVTALFTSHICFAASSNGEKITQIVDNKVSNSSSPNTSLTPSGEEMQDLQFKFNNSHNEISLLSSAVPVHTQHDKNLSQMEEVQAVQGSVKTNDIVVTNAIGESSERARQNESTIPVSNAEHSTPNTNNSLTGETSKNVSITEHTEINKKNSTSLEQGEAVLNPKTNDLKAKNMTSLSTNSTPLSKDSEKSTENSTGTSDFIPSTVSTSKKQPEGHESVNTKEEKDASSKEVSVIEKSKMEEVQNVNESIQITAAKNTDEKKKNVIEPIENENTTQMANENDEVLLDFILNETLKMILNSKDIEIQSPSTKMVSSEDGESINSMNPTTKTFEEAPIHDIPEENGTDSTQIPHKAPTKKCQKDLGNMITNWSKDNSEPCVESEKDGSNHDVKKRNGEDDMVKHMNEIDEEACSAKGSICVNLQTDVEYMGLSPRLISPRITISTLDLDNMDKYCPPRLDKMLRERPTLKGTYSYCVGYDEDNLDTLTPKKKKILTRDIMNDVQKLIANRTLVHRLQGPLSVPIFAPESVCSNFNIPESHHKRGVWGADVVFYVAAGPMKDVERETSLWAERCPTRNGEPIVVVMNFNPRRVITDKNITSLAVEVISSALGISKCKYGKSLLRTQNAEKNSHAEEHCMSVKCENGHREQVKIHGESAWKECMTSSMNSDERKEDEITQNMCEKVQGVCLHSHKTESRIAFSNHLRPMRVVMSVLDIGNSQKYCPESSRGVKTIRSTLKDVNIWCYRHMDRDKSDALTLKKMDVLNNEILPELASIFETTALFHRRRVPFKIPLFQRKTTCSHFSVPFEHNDKGINDTDVVVYVAAAPVPLYHRHLPVWSVPCAAVNGRVVAVALNFNPGLIMKTAETFEAARNELSAVLGVSQCPEENAVMLPGKINGDADTMVCVSVRCEDEETLYVRYKEEEEWNRCQKGERVSSNGDALSVECPEYSEVCNVSSKPVLSTEEVKHYREEKSAVFISEVDPIGSDMLHYADTRDLFGEKVAKKEVNNNQVQSANKMAPNAPKHMKETLKNSIGDQSHMYNGIFLHQTEGRRNNLKMSTHKSADKSAILCSLIPLGTLIMTFAVMAI